MVRHHLQDMGMSADEDLGPVMFDESSRLRVITAGGTSDMSHEDRDSLDFQELVFRILETYVLAIAVAGDADQGLELPDAVGERESSSEISGMPDDIDRREELLECVAENAVGIGDETYVHDYMNLKYAASAAVTAAVSVRRRDEPR